MDVGDVEARWEVLTAFAQLGLARGEKVMLILDPDDLNDDDAVARLDGGTGHVAAARGCGQLVVARNTPFYFPDGRFDADQLRKGYAAATEQAVTDGYRGLRVTISMSWSPRAGWSDEELLAWESSVEQLFTASPFAALCWYDRERFSEGMLAGARRVHPVTVLDGLGSLEVTRHPTRTRIAGSAELGTRKEFGRILGAALARRPDHGPLHVELDLADLCHMDARCAWMLIDLAVSLPPRDRLVVRCLRTLEMVLRGLGADGVPQLELVVAGRPGPDGGRGVSGERLLDLGFTRADLPLVRVGLAAGLLRAGMTEPALGAFVHAALEVVTNAVVHGRGEGWIFVLAGDGRVTCEVTDRGPGPAAVALRNGGNGRGLMLTEALAGRLDVRPGPGNRGTTVTLAAPVR
jgi:anti-sigma regulatory factor (Ser/Thr protein kinase)